MFQGLEHTAISSPDPQKLAQWYVDHLGFHINFTYSGNYFVKAPNGTMLEIIPADRLARRAADHGQQQRSAASGISPSPATISTPRISSSRRKASISWASRSTTMGNRLVFFNDGDGNLLHLIQREKPLP